MINRTMTTECPIKYICKQKTDFCGDAIQRIDLLRNSERSPTYHRCRHFISLKNWILELINEEAEK